MEIILTDVFVVVVDDELTWYKVDVNDLYDDVIEYGRLILVICLDTKISL